MTKIFLITFMILVSSTFIRAELFCFNLILKNNNSEPFPVQKLLNQLEWDSIKTFSETNDGHYAYEKLDGLMKEYKYVQQGYVSHFKVISYDGYVLEFSGKFNYLNKFSEVAYFDKEVWLKYVDDALTDLTDDFKIGIEEPVRVLRSYYNLLGVNAREEYGWICESSTIDVVPKMRMAVINLIQLQRNDLLIKLLEFPNPHVQLYAADALIYIDYNRKSLIKKEVQKGKTDIATQSFLEYLEGQLLSTNEWQKIYNIRDSKKKITICDNFSFNQKYASELLSDKSISEIPDNYEMLINLGYFE